MALENYARIMGDAAEFAMMPYNSLQQSRQLAAAEQRRNALVQNDADRLAFTQQQAQAKAQQDDEDDAEWDAAYAAQDWGTMARLDPQTTKVLWDREQSLKPQPVKRDIRNVGGSLLEIPAEGDPRVLYREPQSQGQPTEAPADQRLFQWFSQLAPEQQAAYLNMKRSNATPEAAGAIAGAKTTAQEQAKSTAAAQADLPRVESNAADMRMALGNLKSAPGLKYIFGAASLVPPIPGTPQADAFAIWEQVQGKAFLEAFNTLKGGGQITEKEGEKATAAITRLSNRRQSLESAKAAIGELEGVVRAAESRARAKAGSQAAAKPSAKSPPKPGDNEKGYIFIGGDPADRKNWVKTR